MSTFESLYGTPDYAWWRNALETGNTTLDGNLNEPQCGFYKSRRKGESRYLSAPIWKDSHTGELRCQVGDKDLTERQLLEAWPFIRKNPVSAEDYATYINTGKWPGESEAVIGHNAAPPDDSLEAIVERISDLVREAELMIAHGAATTKATADRASDLSNTLGELEAKAERLRVIEKQPYLDACREVDGRWGPTRDRAKTWKARLKAAVVDPWLKAAKVAAEAAAAAAVERGAEPTGMPAPRITAGESKRSVHLRTYTLARVTDWKALFDHLQNNQVMRDVAQGIANTAAKNGTPLPGTEIHKEERAA